MMNKGDLLQWINDYIEEVENEAIIRLDGGGLEHAYGPDQSIKLDMLEEFKKIVETFPGN